MPPTSKITTAVLDAALTERSGCVVEVADDLGISRNEVYRKCRIYGLDPVSYRDREVTFSSEGETSRPTDCMSSDADPVSLPSNATRRVEELAHTFGGMVEQAATVLTDFGAAIKARAGSGRREKARLLAHQEKEQDAVRREMMACLNRDMTPSDLLQMLHERYLPILLKDFRAWYAEQQREQEKAQ